MLDVVKNAKSAITSKDFSSMLNSITLLQKEIDAGNTDPEIKSTFRLLKVLLDKEMDRREEIQRESELYSFFENCFKKYEDQCTLYNELLSDPRASTYVYSSSPANDFETSMNDYIDSIRGIFSFAPSPINSMKDVLAQRDLLEKVHDASAFKINKLNGIYEKTLAEQDIAKAEELAKNMKDYEKAFKAADKKFNDDTVKYKSDVAERKKDKADFKKELHDLGLTDDQVKEYTAQGAKKKIKDKVDELNTKTPRTTDEDKLLALLQKAPVSPRLSHPKEVDVAGLKAKYGIDKLEAIFAKYEVKDLDELKAKLDPFIHPTEFNYADLSANSKESIIDMRREQALNVISNAAPSVNQPPITDLPDEAKESIDSAVNFIRSQGYINAAGKNQIRRYEPIVEGKGKDKKVTSVKVITESMDDIVEDPKKAYKEALKDFEKRAKLVDPKYRSKLREMKKASKKLSKDGNLDELIKRTVSLKSAISSTDIRTVMLDHADKDVISRYIGDELNYQVPHVDPTVGRRKGIFGIQVEANGYTDEPNTALILKDEHRSLISTHAYKPNSKVQVQNDRLAKTKAIKDKENEEIEM